MNAVKPCNTYHAVKAGTKLFRVAEGRTVLKVYFVDIIGQKAPSLTV